jgi:hypothetical protein
MKFLNILTQQKINKALFLVALLLSTLCSFIYSIYNSDYHHWGFILGTSLDYIEGKKLFKEVYIQYGAGQPYLYFLLSLLVDINYVSIGFITGIIYSFTIFILYNTLIKITSFFTTSVISISALLFHPYSFYPWPDYYSGLCLIISTSLIILNNDKFQLSNSIIAGLLLVLACVFRSTYLINISSAFIIFYFYCYITKIFDNKFINDVLISFITGLTIYVLFLFINDDLNNWFKQSIGAANSSYGLGWKNIVYLIINIISPSKFLDMIFSLMFMASVFYLIYFALDAKEFNSSIKLNQKFNNTNLIFIIVLGLTGFIQCLKIYENFRLQAACIPLYLVSAIFLDKLLLDKNNLKYWKYAISFIIILPLFLKLPFQILGREGMLFPLIDFNIKTNSDGILSYKNIENIKVLKNKKLDDQSIEYYSNLYKILCVENKYIINLTADSMIPYLCEKPKNLLSLPFFDSTLISNTNFSEIKRINDKNYNTNEFIISYYLINDPKFFLLNTIHRPDSYRWLKGGKVYIYKYL